MRTLIITILVATAGLCACSHTHDNFMASEAYAKITDGMSRPQVESIYGKPLNTISNSDGTVFCYYVIINFDPSAPIVTTNGATVTYRDNMVIHKMPVATVNAAQKH